jgi:hypothetical protein
MEVKYCEFIAYKGKRSFNSAQFRNKQYLKDKKFRIKSLEDNNEIVFSENTIMGAFSIDNPHALPIANTQYSLDGDTWYDANMNQSIILNKYDKLYLRWSGGFNLSWSKGEGILSYPLLSSSKTFSVYGDIKDLTTNKPENCRYLFYKTKVVDASNLILSFDTLTSQCFLYMFCECASLTAAPELPATTLADYCYLYMFRNCTSLVSAPELPATTLADYCYDGMFRYCTSLVSAPELPATTLADSCYHAMFSYCSSLTTAPELPATTLADSCYCGMFETCTSLVSAPELPATTLADYCYLYMFRYCTSLVSAPELPATTLADSCYCEMFSNCTKLNYIKCLAVDISANRCTLNWVVNVSPIGNFIKHPNNMIWTRGENGIPTGWDVLSKSFYIQSSVDNNVIDLSTSTWAGSNASKVSYSINDGDWIDGNTITTYTLNKNDKLYISSYNIAKTSASELPLIKSTGAFSVHGNINNIISSAGSYACYALFKGTKVDNASDLTLPATSIGSYMYHSMFMNCTSLTNTPKILATSIGGHSCRSMFEGCTSLQNPSYTFAPSSVGTYGCYRMFAGSGIKNTNCKLPSPNTSYCYAYMFYNCTSLTAAGSIASDSRFASYSCYSMFERCTSLQSAPQLSGTLIADYAFVRMFYGCSSLNYLWCYAIPATLTEVGGVPIKATLTTGTQNWVTGVPSGGHFYYRNNTGTLVWNRLGSGSGIPSGWTAHTV